MGDSYKTHIEYHAARRFIVITRLCRENSEVGLPETLIDTNAPKKRLANVGSLITVRGLLQVLKKSIIQKKNIYTVPSP